MRHEEGRLGTRTAGACRGCPRRFLGGWGPPPPRPEGAKRGQEASRTSLEVLREGQRLPDGKEPRDRLCRAEVGGMGTAEGERREEMNGKAEAPGEGRGRAWSEAGDAAPEAW